MKLASLFVLCTLFIVACNSGSIKKEGRDSATQDTRREESIAPDSDSKTRIEPIEVTNEKSEDAGTSGSKTKRPRNVRDFFMLLPEDYFVIESCDRTKDKNCQRSKREYLRTYLSVEDKKNGYLETGGDGAQSTLRMTIFKRPDNSYLVGLTVFGEAEDSYKFLEVVNGKWDDVSIEIVPEYSRTNIYELPRYGTRVSVFAKRIKEQRENFELSEKGEKLYELEWKEGGFSIKR